MGSFVYAIETFFSQKIIYDRLRNIWSVPVIQVQKAQPNDTLEENGLIDGSTIKVNIETAEAVNLTVKLGPKAVTCALASTWLVCHLKDHLKNIGTIGLALDAYRLVISADDNAGISHNISMLDESLPLHLYGVKDKMTLRIIRECIMIELVTQAGHHFYKPFPKTMTIKQMKQTIRSISSFFVTTEYLTDIWLFVKNGEDYHKLEEDVPIGTILHHRDIVHIVEDRFYTDSQLVPVLSGGILDSDCGEVGYNIQDTVWSLKLRVQEYLGYPVSSLDVKAFQEGNVSEAGMVSLGNEIKFVDGTRPHVIRVS